MVNRLLSLPTITCQPCSGTFFAENKMMHKCNGIIYRETNCTYDITGESKKNIKKATLLLVNDDNYLKNVALHIVSLPVTRYILLMTL